MGYFSGMFPIPISFESGFSGLQRTSSVQVQWSFVDNYFIPSFSPMRYASAKGQETKAPFYNNLSTQTNDVIVNPGNPDSKTNGCCARNFLRRLGNNLWLWVGKWVLQGISLVNIILNQDLQDFEDCRGRLRFGCKGHLQITTLDPPFRRCVTHRRKGQETKAPFYNNFSTQTNDVIINPGNPENPDSKPMTAAHAISCGDWGTWFFFGYFL